MSSRTVVESAYLTDALDRSCWKLRHLRCKPSANASLCFSTGKQTRTVLGMGFHIPLRTVRHTEGVYVPGCESHAV